MFSPKFLDVRGTRTRYFETGAGDPLVLIHGGEFGHYYSAYTWSLNFPLAENFHLYAFDKLGMGYTDNPRTDKDYTIGGTLDHARDFMMAMEIEKACLVGHSRGGFLVTRLALEYPDLVKSLVIVDSATLAPADPSDPNHSQKFYDELEKNAPLVETKESVQRECIANSFSTRHVTEDYVEEIYRIALLPKTIEARQKMDVLGKNFFLPDLLRKKEETLELLKAGRLRIPVLVIWGLNDPSAPLKQGLKLFDILSAQIPRSQFHIFNQAGHYVSREHAEDFNRVVATFLKSNH